MQTVPSEFVCQLRPLMFVAGLGTEQQEQGGSTCTSTDTLSFHQLTQSLRRVFAARKGYPVYDNLSAKRKTDHNVVLVEKNVRFPPRKARLQNGQGGAHSPISPFTPTSPLYPDGLIAPIWIRKHRELIPSAFVLVLRLYEFGALLEDGTPDVAELEVGPLDKEKVERLRDNELVNEIMNRKRVCNERGIKLAVVLLASRELLDDPALDARLSHIRRLSGLDSRASLFVLSPVPTKEVQNFVASLQGELLESSIDYYREHGRRLRRKRARPANSNTSVSINSSIQPERNGTGTPHATLNNTALNVRYEFKAATFAEFRAEIEVALKHYEDCYNTLLDLFTNPVSVNNPHPFIMARTKRWAEARVLADCIIVKICKMYLYAGNAEYAALTHREHIRRLSRISADKWGIDETSFEYWSWESKQHRIFGDLLEAAMSSGFQIPQTPGPAPGPPLQARASAQHVPAQVLQHPGAYYLRAGLAAEKRQKLFRETLQEYENSYSKAMTDPTVEEPPKMSAALAHEKSAPHTEQIIELYTKAYDHYKGSKGVRMTLSLAYLIAGVHHQTQNLETALRFDERIGRTYRREQWLGILDKILGRDDVTLRKQIKNAGPDGQALVEDSPSTMGEIKGENSEKRLTDTIREALKVCLERVCLAEELHPEHPQSSSSPADTARVLFALLRDLPASISSATSIIELTSTNSKLPFHFNSVFWRAKSELGSLVPYQISFRSQAIADGVFDNATAFNSIEIHFSDQRTPLSVENDDTIKDANVMIASRQSRASGNIRSILYNGSITSTLTSSHAQTISITSVLVSFTIASYRLALDLHPSSIKPLWACAVDGTSLTTLQTSSLTSGDFGQSCSFEPRKIRLQLESTASSPAYLNEAFPIELLVTNNDKVNVALYLDALLHPLVHPHLPSSDAIGDYIQLEEEQTKGISISNALLIQELSPGQTHSTTIYLSTFASPGERNVDISVVAKPAASPEQDVQVAVTELSKQLAIDTVHPFFCDSQATWHRPKTAAMTKGNSLLALDSPTIEESGHRLLLDVILGALGPEALSVKSVALIVSGSKENVRLLGDTLEEDDILQDSWEPQDPFRITYELLVNPHATKPAGGMLDIIWSRSSMDQMPGTTTTTRIPLPDFVPPAITTSPQIAAYYPPSAILHKPFKVRYTLECPSDWTPAPIQLTFQMESGSENFVFSGPRKTQRTLVLHDPDSGPYQLAEFTLIPIANTAMVELPRFRCWQVLETPMQHSQRVQALEQEYYDPETGQGRLTEEDSRVRMRELKVVEGTQEIIVPSAAHEDTPSLGNYPLRIFVLPR